MDSRVPPSVWVQEMCHGLAGVGAQVDVGSPGQIPIVLGVAAGMVPAELAAVYVPIGARRPVVGGGDDADVIDISIFAAFVKRRRGRTLS